MQFSFSFHHGGGKQRILLDFSINAVNVDGGIGPAVLLVSASGEPCMLAAIAAGSDCMQRI